MGRPAVAGVGFGLALLGVNRILIALAAPAQRAGLIAAIFIINFLGLSIPALIAGVATAHVGLHRTALAYCVAMATLVAAAAGSLLLRNCGTATGQGTSYAQVRRRPVRAEGPGQPGRPSGMAPRQCRRPRVECQVRSARIRDTAGSTSAAASAGYERTLRIFPAPQGREFRGRGRGGKQWLPRPGHGEDAMAYEHYDAIVIGTSQGGRFLPVELAKAGQKVALVERDQLGGVCVNTGCTPTKTMVASARLAYQARRGGEYGVRTGPVSVDLAAVRERKRAMVAGARQNYASRLAQDGLT